MSYDISLGDKAHFNITYNLQPILSKYFGEKSIRLIYGLTGIETQGMLSAFVLYMIQNHNELEQLNPENGWGSLDQLIGIAAIMSYEAAKNPMEIWEGD